MALDGFSALVAVLAQAVTVHAYALVGVPVSTAQAIIGAVLDIGLRTRARTVSWRLLGGIIFGQVAAPAIAGVVPFAVG